MQCREGLTKGSILPHRLCHIWRSCAAVQHDKKKIDHTKLKCCYLANSLYTSLPLLSELPRCENTIIIIGDCIPWM